MNPPRVGAGELFFRSWIYRSWEEANVKMDQAELFRMIQIYDFVIHDTALYLDTHPTDQVALEYYEKIRDLYKKVVAEYVACYGPITIEDVDARNKWTWIEKPWPWEMEA
jgi:spore coat protein JB